ncbi:hypothetical protein ACA910_012024 [Epithemia clementina (nom. ined.)]
MTQAAMANYTGNATNAETEEELRNKMMKKFKEAYKGLINFCDKELDDWHEVIAAYPTELYNLESAKWRKDEYDKFKGKCSAQN